MWDPERVFSFIAAQGTRERPLAFLSRKTAVLLALASLLRVSELASINYSSIRFAESAVSFSLLRPRKAQHSGPLQTIALTEFENTLCCPVEAMRTYQEKTSALRSASSETFFIGLIPPYSDVSANTISRWIKEFLKLAGIDTSIFSAHSTRGAAASSAAAKGVAIDSVLRAGNWARESTFRKFYNRRIESYSEAQPINV